MTFATDALKAKTTLDILYTCLLTLGLSMG
jgi:hypothetical protein